MKVHLYCPETGIYQGQDFTDAAPMMRTSYELPPGATAIAPPAYGTGEVPVFLAAEGRWILRRLVRLQDWHLVPARESQPVNESQPVKREPPVRPPAFEGV